MNKDLNFKYIEEFASYIIGRLEDCEELFVAVVGKFKTIKPLLKEVMTYEFMDFESIEIESEVIDGYTDEFILSFWMNDGVIEVGCEKLKRDGEYTNPCGDETYLLEDCSSKVIPLCEDSDLHFVSFDEDCDEECCECCSCGCYCKDIEDSGKEKSSHIINGKPVSREEFDKEYKKFHSECEKNMKNIFDEYCKFIELLMF